MQAAKATFHPDVGVTCGPRDAHDPAGVHGPMLRVDVLSPTTSAIDRGEKSAACRRLPELIDDVLIASTSERLWDDVPRVDATPPPVPEQADRPDTPCCAGG